MGLVNNSQTVLGDAAIQPAQRVIDMDNTIHLLEPNKTPLTVFMGRLKRGRVTGNPEFNWLEDILQPKTLTGGAAIAAGATAYVLAAAEGTKVAVNDLIKNPATGEIFLVTAVVTDTLTIVRAFGTTAAAAIGADQAVLIIGNANRENAERRDILATTTTKKTNYAQIFRTPLGFSRVTKDGNLYGGNYGKYQIRKKGIDHEVEMERQYLFGEPFEQTTTTGGRWASGGIDHFISTNRYDAGGTLDYATFLDFAQQVFRYGNQSMRLMLAAPIIISAIDAMAATRLFTKVEGTVFGVRINKVQTSHGEFALVKHVLLSETSFFNERAFALDMDMMQDRIFTNANTKLRMGIQNNSVDGEEHEYLTHKGLQFQNEEASGVITNVTSF